jgi:hypothetical protein
MKSDYFTIMVVAIFLSLVSLVHSVAIPSADIADSASAIGSTTNNVVGEHQSSLPLPPSSASNISEGDLGVAIGLPFPTTLR